MISLKNVEFAYGTQEGGSTVLKNLELEVPGEKTLAIVGISGSGKTTLLHVMAGLLRPTAGIVYFDGAELTGPRSEIAVVFQDHQLFPWKNVAENVGLPLRLQKDKQEKDKVAEVLERLGIKEHTKKYPMQLSGGQRQRAAVGRAIIGNPRVLLMDEPFSALDPLTRRILRRDISDLCVEKKLSCALVTHSIEEALVMGDRIAVFAPEGRIIAGTLENTGRLEDGYITSRDFIIRSEKIREMLEGSAC